ncbi:MAG TPA: hypothetical protein VEL31_23165 [Ktedonobacteraceae bacterium]|nr:hypothetical protein [Ktedonobacteraceae bacterium]
MLQTSTSLLKRLAPPALAKTGTEKYLAEKAAVHKIIWLDIAIAVVILADFVLSLIDVTVSHWYVGAIEVVLSLYLLALLLARNIRPLVGRLLLAGFIAALCELFTDASGQYVVHSLTYPAGALSLWTSPLYMPLSWMVILTGTGYVAWRLRALLGWRKAALLSGIWGTVQIPLYEEMAYYGGWWRYRATHLMIGHTPIYVLLFEGLIVAALPLLYDRIERHSWGQVALTGVVLGAWMPVVALISWLLLGW